jgi:hypothetical protein
MDSHQDDEVFASGQGCSREAPISTEDWKKSDPDTKLLSPLFFSGSDFDRLAGSMEGEDPHEIPDRFAWISYALIFNLAVTAHRRAIVTLETDCDKKYSQTALHLFGQATGLYQCVYDGIDTHEYSQRQACEETQTKQMVFKQRLLLSVLHNMGILFGGLEGSATTQRQWQSTSFRCFQLVFATLHSLKDYYGIEKSDFPNDFDAQLVVETALDQLSICPDSSGSSIDRNVNTAPCA